MSRKQNFINSYMPFAQEQGQRLGVDPRLILAQSAIETGWGRKVPGNNFFGIKSHGQKGGQTFGTHEYINGKRVNIKDSFRGYASPKESFVGYGDFLTKNKRYRRLLETKGLENQLSALGRSGYATDPNYASKVGSIARGMPQVIGFSPSAKPLPLNTVPQKLLPNGGKQDMAIKTTREAPQTRNNIIAKLLGGGKVADPSYHKERSRALLAQALNGNVKTTMGGIGKLAMMLGGKMQQGRYERGMEQQKNEKQALIDALKGKKSDFINTNGGEFAQKLAQGGFVDEGMRHMMMNNDPNMQMKREQTQYNRGQDAIANKRNAMADALRGEKFEYQQQRDAMPPVPKPMTTQGQINQDANNQFITPEQQQAAMMKANSVGKGVTVNTGGGVKLPTGYALNDPNDPSKGMYAVSGSPDDAKRIALDKKAKGAMHGLMSQWGIVDDQINQAIELSNGWNVDTVGSFAQHIPGIEAFDLANILNSIKANVGFDKLQNMRDNSPTGGALGNVSEMENRLLQAVKGSLEQGQSAAQLKQNLRTIQNDMKGLRQFTLDGYTKDYGDYEPPIVPKDDKPDLKKQYGLD